MLPTYPLLLPTKEGDDAGDAGALLGSVDGRVVLLHPFRGVAEDGTRHDVFHLRGARQIVEGPA